MRTGGALLLIGLALGASGCTQTTSQLAAEPVVTGPLVLNSAPGAVPAADASATTGTAPTGTSATVSSAAPAPVAPAPVATATPAPAPAPEPLPVAAPATAAAEPLPTAAPAAATTKDGFPNLNVPPPEPGGALLPAEERARIIAELEALRARQGAPGGGGGNGGSDLANQAETHGQAAIKQIEACSEEGALQNNPDCAPD